MASPRTHSFLDKIQKNGLSSGHFLCVGLDPDPKKLPAIYPQTVAGVETFLDDIVAITAPYVVAYKPNISFFEAMGIDGLRILERLVAKIPETIPVIMDGKRGDIGNTSTMQARYLFDYFGADASTLHPYMGRDSLEPFFTYRDKYHFVLALTSNPSANEFETLRLESGKRLYEAVIQSCLGYHKTYENVGMVVGATQDMPALRTQSEDLLFLVPGVGAQGGAYQHAYAASKRSDGLALINVSRAVLYPQGISNSIRSLEKLVVSEIHSLITQN